MIESISIAKTASFDKEEIKNFSKINFIYGPNASGKTTVSRIIASEHEYNSCEVKWKNNLKLEPIVYNSDFIEENFNEPLEMKGVFTLGKDNIKIKEKITIQRTKLEKINNKIATLTRTLNGSEEENTLGKVKELEILQNNFIDNVWELKTKYDAQFSVAFKGFRNSKMAFFNKFIQPTKPKSELLSIEELNQKASIIFDRGISTLDNFETFELKAFDELDASLILQKPIIGKEDVDIATMITKLNNSDWVKAGRTYFERNNKICPFCQQTTPASFELSLNEYFDETYDKEIQELNYVIKRYNSKINEIKEIVFSIQENSNHYIDVQKLDTTFQLFLKQAEDNFQLLKFKENEPSKKIILKPMEKTLAPLLDLISEANIKIDSHNRMVADLKQQQELLTNQVWYFIYGKRPINLC